GGHCSAHGHSPVAGAPAIARPRIGPSHDAACEPGRRLCYLDRPPPARHGRKRTGNGSIAPFNPIGSAKKAKGEKVTSPLLLYPICRRHGNGRGAQCLVAARASATAVAPASAAAVAATAKPAAPVAPAMIVAVPAVAAGIAAGITAIIAARIAAGDLL